MSIDQLLALLAQRFSLRHRYILTRRNRLRLRFLAMPLALLLILGLSFTTSFIYHKLSPSDVTLAGMNIDELDPEAKLYLEQRRLQRYGEKGQVLPSEDKALRFAKMPKPELKPKEKTLKIGSGDTLAGVLQKAGMGASQAYKAVMAMEEHYDPRKIRPGQILQVRFDPNGDHYQFAQLSMEIDPLRSLTLEQAKDGQYKSAIVEKEVVSKRYTGKADIEVSLYGSALKAGISAPVIADAIHIFSWDVDFQRDIRKGDSLELMYDQVETPEGERVKSGNILYARLNVNGQDIPVYRFKTSDGDIDYFTDKGVSIRKALMQTPIDGARLSSGFGMRRHPVLGYNKMHKGVDFAAPSGTPIYAAGDGTIEKAGRWNSYGNYVRIRHNAILKTAYAHMKNFAKGITIGKRVKQGQVIGYVGTTGRSTGPHLHYEVLKNGHQVNPKKLKLPQGETLKGDELSKFKKFVEKLDREYNSLSKKTTLAASRKKAKAAM